MPATISLCQRNGAVPGVVTQNIANINWKSIDDTTTPYTNYNAVIGLGSNSFTNYAYIKFSGSFTTIGNVSVTHLSGALPSGVKLMSSPTITLDTAKLPYATPDRTVNNAVTSYNLSSVGNGVNLLVGVQGTASDPANAPGKTNIASNSGLPLFTNYFVTQIQAGSAALAGDIGNIVLQITYDEA